MSHLPLESDKTALAHLVEHLAHLLPAQGPIGVFIHHNTLHAFEDQTFDAALEHGQQVFGCQPYLTEERYREELRRGRIRFAELQETLVLDVGERATECVTSFCRRLDLHLAMLQYPLYSASKEELLWHMAETDAVRVTRPDVSEVSKRNLINETRHWVMRSLRGKAGAVPAWSSGLLAQFNSTQIEQWSESAWEAFTLSALWNVCLDGVRDLPQAVIKTKPMLRHRDVLLASTEQDSDALVHELLIRFCAGFLDQGLAHWDMPERDSGFYAAFCALYSGDAGVPAPWMRGLKSELSRLKSQNITAEACLEESLATLGVTESEREAYLTETLLALRGWAGMIWHIEERGDRAHHGVPAGSLMDFLAVRLLLERFALTHLAGKTPLGTLRTSMGVAQNAAPALEQRAFAVFQLAQILGWTPEELYQQPSVVWQRLVEEIEGFSELQRRRIFHRAYERRFRVQTLDALALHNIDYAKRENKAPKTPIFQAMFCIDEREESIRRHVEEVAPEAQTFGAAGFFGAVIYYKGAAERDFIPLCPVVVQPQHWIIEQVDESLQDVHIKRTQIRQRVGKLFHKFEKGSKTPLIGALVSTGVGVLATVPLVMRVLFPRLTAQLKGYFHGFIAPPPRTRLSLERQSEKPEAVEGGYGFIVEEMTNITEKLLRDTGLTHHFARLIFIFGHGSTSMNNPHESAHDCGACGGGRGGPNARLVAQMFNDPRVRAGLKTRGLTIPDETVFVGGLHNTSSETLTVFDTDTMPATHQAEFAQYIKLLEEAATRNAHERARRFASAPLALSTSEARKHVEGRAEDLSQVRPEWGHATNAICLVGRRERSRDLFLDRRAFLVSYDPTQDTIVPGESAILARILQAVVPVCSGINLEYYFSYVDSPGWGAGSKLPHNITSLLGVMDGAQSDLRTGLPWQMVEIHEPVRLLFILETTIEALTKIMASNPFMDKMVRNQWVQLAALAPDSNTIMLFEDGEFVPYMPQQQEIPTARSSQEWYTGWRDHLDFAQIKPQLKTEVSHV
jgi:uncharacterized protein